MCISQPNAIDRLLSPSTCKGEHICQMGLLRSSLIHSPVFSSPARFSSFAAFIKPMSQHTDDVINAASCNAGCGRPVFECDFTIEWKDVLQPFFLSRSSLFRGRAFICLAYIKGLRLLADFDCIQPSNYRDTMADSKVSGGKIRTHGSSTRSDLHVFLFQSTVFPHSSTCMSWTKTPTSLVWRSVRRLSSNRTMRKSSSDPNE